MRNTNAHVGTISGVDGLTVRLEGDRSVRLDATDRGTAYARIFEQLQKEGKPVYIEVDPATNAVSRVLLPAIVRIQEIVPDKEGNLRVRLERSHAMPAIRRSSPDFEEVAAALRVAHGKGELVALTFDKSDIIDVRPWKPPGELPPPVIRELPRPAVEWWRWRCWPWNWFRRRCCVSPRRAQQLFDLCAAQSCNPVTVPVPCIPFLYPDDGCWARASEMCRLMINAGALPRKIWIDGTLHALTRNNPQCFVDWGWHVAPVLCVRRWRWLFCCCFGRDMVIDPSLFTTPVTKAQWKGVQGDPAATLTITAHTYYASWHPSDPTYSETNLDLATYRTRLHLRSIGPDGPPPYAACP